MERLRLEIEGMHCGACVRRVEQRLGSLPGVVVDEVLVGEARLGMDPSLTDRERILGALDEMGHPARIEIENG